MRNWCFKGFYSDNSICQQAHCMRNWCFTMLILFVGRSIAYEMGVLKLFIVRLLFADRLIAC